MAVHDGSGNNAKSGAIKAAQQGQYRGPERTGGENQNRSQGKGTGRGLIASVVQYLV